MKRKPLYNTATRKPVSVSALDRLNSPFLALIVLAGFVALCVYAYPHGAPSKHADKMAMNEPVSRFVAFQIKQAKINSYHKN